MKFIVIPEQLPKNSIPQKTQFRENSIHRKKNSSKIVSSDLRNLERVMEDRNIFILE